MIDRHALGSLISKTRGVTDHFSLKRNVTDERLVSEFAVLEALLNLFAILLPSSTTPQKRTSYIRDVFSEYANIIELLDGMTSGQWDETAAKVIDILAASDISLYVVLAILNFTSLTPFVLAHNHSM